MSNPVDASRNKMSVKILHRMAGEYTMACEFVVMNLDEIKLEKMSRRKREDSRSVVSLSLKALIG